MGYFAAALDRNLAAPERLHSRRAELGLTPAEVAAYLRAITYRFNDHVWAGLQHFRELDSRVNAEEERCMMRAIEEKVRRGERLTPDDARLLLTEAPLLEVGALADEIRRERFPGSRVTYVVDTNLNYTNLCDAYCSFCAFYRPHTGSAEDGYTHSVDDMMERIRRRGRSWLHDCLSCRAVSIPSCPSTTTWQWCAEARARFPEITPHFWSPPEIYEMAKVSGLSYHQVLQALWDAGQRTLPGGGAEVLTNSARHAISPLKMNADEWIAVVRAAHEVGFRGTATMMYGHLEQVEDLVEHLDRIRRLQDDTGGFYAFVPWSFAPGRHTIGTPPEKPPGRRQRLSAHHRRVASLP